MTSVQFNTRTFLSSHSQRMHLPFVDTLRPVIWVLLTFSIKHFLEKYTSLSSEPFSSSLSSPIPYFAEDREHVTQLEGSYDLEALVQCSPDLDPRNCTECLRLAVEDFFECCSHARLAQIIFPKCLVMYNVSALQPSLGVINGQ